MTDTTDPAVAFSAALVEAQRNLRTLRKASFNQHSGYAYVSMDDITAECRRALNDAGLSFSRTAMSVEPDFAHPTGLTATYELRHAAGHVQVITTQMPVLVQKGRPPDKAVTTALTYAQGFTLRDVLAAARSDGEPDDEGVDEDLPRDYWPRIQAAGAALGPRAGEVAGMPSVELRRAPTTTKLSVLAAMELEVRSL